MEKIVINKERINDLVIIAKNHIGKTNDEIGHEIGQSAMVFTQIKKQRNLVGFLTLALMRKKYGLNINAIVDEDEQHLFDENNYKSILEELHKEKLENEELKKERDFFKKVAMGNMNL